MAEYGRLTRSSRGKEGRAITISVLELSERETAFVARWLSFTYWRCRTNRIQAEMPRWTWGLADAYATQNALDNAFSRPGQPL